MDIEQQVQFTHRHELNRMEGDFIRRLRPSLNKSVAGRTIGEYYQDNRQAIIERAKQYYHDNKATLAEKAKQNKHECPCGGRYINTHQHRRRHFQSQWHNKMAEYIQLYEYIVQM